MYDSKYDLLMERITVTIPKATLAKIKRAAGRRGVSKFLTEAAKAHLARNELQRWFDEMDAKYGKAPASLVRRIDRDGRKIFGMR
jgi:hypothetical protein